MHPTNRTILQGFEWHTPSTPTHYVHLESLIPDFVKLGVTSLLLPPGCKANNPKSNGYDAYDLWDLGEFEQKGARSTKWGNREQLEKLLCTAKHHSVELVWDAVINHKQAGDELENGVWAVEVDRDDRRYEICEPKQIQAWLRYSFPGREHVGMKYSKMNWRAEHFNGTDWDQSREKNAIYKLINDPSSHPPFKRPTRPASSPIAPPRNRLAMLRRRFSSQSKKTYQKGSVPLQRPGKGWAEDVDTELGNSDYLIFSNIDYNHPEAREDVLNWGVWMRKDVGVSGFRLDAARHISYSFTREWIQRVNEGSKQNEGKDTFVVGEIWSGEVQSIFKWLDTVQQPRGPQVYAYDVPLLYNFSRISEDVRTRSKNTDLRTIPKDSLVENRPRAAVTFVTNHDTQPGQTCYTPMQPVLKPLFYAFVLLRQDGYPCIFWGDLFGTHGPQAEPPACMISDGKSKDGKRSILPDLMLCRKVFAYGEQTDYWDSPTCVGWTRAGGESASGCAVIINIASRDSKKMMRVGNPGEAWTDVLATDESEIKIDEKGYGRFPCKALSVAVFVQKAAKRSHGFPATFNVNVYNS